MSKEQPTASVPGRNPPWSRDELILALDLYIRHGGAPLGPGHSEVIELSALLNQLSDAAGSATFRNSNGVAMKLMNFRSLDPVFTARGGAGLKAGGKGDNAVWDEFAHDPLALGIAALEIRAQEQVHLTSTATDDELEDYNAPEGKVLFRMHRVRERDPQLVARRKRYTLRDTGKLACEACGFDFAAIYGTRGNGYIEAHHTKPVHLMEDGDITKVEDLALLCANCHRMVHNTRPWLSVAELKAILAT